MKTKVVKFKALELRKAPANHELEWQGKNNYNIWA